MSSESHKWDQTWKREASLLAQEEHYHYWSHHERPEKTTNSTWVSRSTKTTVQLYQLKRSPTNCSKLISKLPFWFKGNIWTFLSHFISWLLTAPSRVKSDGYRFYEDERPDDGFVHQKKFPNVEPISRTIPLLLLDILTTCSIYFLSQISME